jgi:hypothetical protein
VSFDYRIIVQSQPPREFVDVGQPSISPKESVGGAFYMSFDSVSATSPDFTAWDGSVGKPVRVVRTDGEGREEFCDGILTSVVETAMNGVGFQPVGSE